MSLLCRRLACMAGLALVALALVACGAGPGATKTSDPVGFKNIEIRQGSTSEISLVNTFSGSELTYSATTSNRSVATVAVDKAKDSLTVTAVGPGTATITVTATDPQERSHRQSFIVTVPRPTASDPVDIPDIPSLEEDATRTIRLGDKFSGEDLTYTATSSSTSVATATADNDADTLTVTAVGPGTATITVTATAQGRATQTQSFTVTVPATVPAPEVTPPATPTTNNPSDCPSPLTIVITETERCKLPSKAILLQPAGGGVTVARSSEVDVWIIKALTKGRYTIIIESGDATKEKLGEIRVVVPNSQPKRDHEPDPGPLTTTETVSPYTYILPDPGTPNVNDTFAKFFNDRDGTEDIINFSVGTKPDTILIEATDKGYVNVGSDGKTLTLEVLEEITEDFQVTLYAHDDSEKSDFSVVLTIEASETTRLNPREATYTVTQGSKGELSDRGNLEVGLRAGPLHSLTFRRYGSRSVDSADDVNGFKFVADAAEADGIKKSKRLDPDQRLATDLNVYHKDNKPTEDTTGWAPGFRFLVLESASAVENAVWPTGTTTLPDTPTVRFSLKKGPASGTIKITYYVVYADGDYPPEGSTDPDPTAKSTATKIDSETLSVKVVVCESPPDMLSDCPPK